MLKSLPVFARRALFDFFTTAIPALLALSALNGTDTVAHAALIALGAAAVGAATRALPGFSEWLSGELVV